MVIHNLQIVKNAEETLMKAKTAEYVIKVMNYYKIVFHALETIN